MKLFTWTRNFASGFFTTVLFLFFLLVSGDIFLLRLVEILPRFRSKRQVVEISQQIEGDVSAYLVTITIMNAAVGIATALAMWLTGVGDPILWGTAAFLLNYVPILGTALGVLIFLLAGMLTHDTLWQALLPAGLYFGFHLIEGETLTPMLLARRFTLNPVLVVISLVFWFWMWGIPGGILSMPMLAITKIIRHLRGLQSPRRTSDSFCVRPITSFVRLSKRDIRFEHSKQQMHRFVGMISNDPCTSGTGYPCQRMHQKRLD